MLICINFEVPGANLDRFATTLVQTGLHLSQESTNQLTHADNSTQGKELAGTLQITFVHNEPDLSREVPAVPG